jgi:DDE superfamily endonuclease
MAPDRGLLDKKQSGVKGKKTQLTYAFTSNADGSEKLPAFIIGKAAQPRVFNKKTGGQLGFSYRNNAKAWMTAHFYQEWIQQWDRKLQEKGHKILLLQDNFPGHIVPNNLQNIRVENFEPNLTAHIQPKDQGIICCFKAHYHVRFIQRAIDRYDEGITPANIYEINQLQAMRLAELAWRDVNTTTIQNCWRKAGILPEIDSSSTCTNQPSIPISTLLDHPSSQMDSVTHAEKQVEAALNDLVATGALQETNRMDIDSLLNPVGKSHDLTETSDDEIYQAVIDAQCTCKY